MNKIITNRDNLKESDITEVVKRVKLLIINSNNEILLCYSHNNYHFPGGHVEDGEDFIETVNREIKEETGVELNVTDIKPFACCEGYWKDWPEVGKNRKTEVYYYEIFYDLVPDLDNTCRTEHEKDGGFCLKYIPLDNLEEELIRNAKEFGDKQGIAREMLELLKVYIR